MPTTIRLSPEVEERLNALATKTGRSKSYYLREFIERGLEDLEDFYDAEAVMERYHRGQERTYTLDEIRAELGLDDRAA